VEVAARVFKNAQDVKSQITHAAPSRGCTCDVSFSSNVVCGPQYTTLFIIIANNEKETNK